MWHAMVCDCILLCSSSSRQSCDICLVTFLQAQALGLGSIPLSAAQDGGAQIWDEGGRKKQRCDDPARNDSTCRTYDLTHVQQSLACGGQSSGQWHVPGPSSPSHELGGASAGSTSRSDQTAVPFRSQVCPTSRQVLSIPRLTP